MIPDLVYQLAALKDIAGGLAEIIQREVTLTDTSADLVVTVYDVPADRVFVLCAASMTSNPGTGQNPSVGALRSEPEAASFPIELMRYPEKSEATAGQVQQGNFHGCTWLAPGSRISARAQFNAGTNANTVIADIHGVSIPRGNIQQG